MKMRCCLNMLLYHYYYYYYNFQPWLLQYVSVSQSSSCSLYGQKLLILQLIISVIFLALFLLLLSRSLFISGIKKWHEKWNMIAEFLKNKLNVTGHFFKLTYIVNIQRSYIFNTFARHELLVNKGEGWTGGGSEGREGWVVAGGCFFESQWRCWTCAKWPAIDWKRTFRSKMLWFKEHVLPATHLKFLHYFNCTLHCSSAS